MCREKADPGEYPYPSQVYPLRAWTSPLPGETRDTHSPQLSGERVLQPVHILADRQVPCMPWLSWHGPACAARCPCASASSVVCLALDTKSPTLERTAVKGHIWTRPRCQGALEWKNTLRDRCSHISGLLVKTFHSLRALMKSALPHLITTAASRALSLHRLGGSRSDRSCHQLDYTSQCAERLLHIPVK
jgi:hypothetical protein